MILFFDLDGPILDVSEKYYQAYANSLKKLGGDVIDKNTYWHLKRSKVADYDILLLTSSESHLEEFLKSRNLLIEDIRYLKFDIVWKDLKETYGKLCGKFPAILVTLRTHPDRTCDQLKNLGIYQWFKSVLVGSGNFINRVEAKVNAV